MLSIAERHKYILDNLNKYGFVRITDVANELGVTKVTIRKDVKILESKGLLYKVHGSARPANPHVADMDVHVNVVQLGGTVHKKSLSVLGEEAARSLDDCICSKLFFGVDGIDLEHGITTSTIDEAKLTRKMMKASSQNIVLADSSKFGQRGFGRICALEDIDVIITDDRISEQMVAIVEEAGVDLIIVK